MNDPMEAINAAVAALEEIDARPNEILGDVPSLAAEPVSVSPEPGARAFTLEVRLPAYDWSFLPGLTERRERRSTVFRPGEACGLCIDAADDGIKLPIAVPGREITIHNNTANPIQIYPAPISGSLPADDVTSEPDIMDAIRDSARST